MIAIPSMLGGGQEGGGGGGEPGVLLISMDTSIYEAFNKINTMVNRNQPSLNQILLIGEEMAKVEWKSGSIISVIVRCAGLC